RVARRRVRVDGVRLGHRPVVPVAQHPHWRVLVLRPLLLGEGERTGTLLAPVRLLGDLDALAGAAAAAPVRRLILVDRLVRAVVVRGVRRGGHVVRLRHGSAVPGAEHANRDVLVRRAFLGSSRQRNSTLLVRVVLLRNLDADRVRAATTGLALAGRILVGALVGGVVVRRRGGRRDRVRLLHVAVVAGAEDANRDVRVRRPHLRRGRLGDAELLVA